MFTNAKKVMINNKEVSSIITSNGGVLYEYPYNFTVTADKSIIQTGDTCHITATVLDIGSIGVPNLPVTFKLYKSSDDSLVETLTGTTDSDGECTVSYLGNHTGQLYIRADCMNLQKTYEILDCIFYDEATSNATKNTNWTSSNATVTVADGYATISKTSIGNANYTPVATMTAPFVVEFNNHLEQDANNYLVIDSLNYMALNVPSTITGVTNYKLIVEANKITKQVGDYSFEKAVNIDFSSGVTATLRVHNVSTHNIGYSDFKIYPI